MLVRTASLMFFSIWAYTVALVATQLSVTTAQSPGEPEKTETLRRLSQCSSEVPPSDVRTIINVVHHAVSTVTFEVVTWVTEVTTVPARTERSTSVVVMIEPSETEGVCESTATVIIPTTATVKVHVKRTTIVTSTPISTRIVYSTSWATQDSVPSFLNGPVEVPLYGAMKPIPTNSEPSWRAVGSPQTGVQTTERTSAFYSPV